MRRFRPPPRAFTFDVGSTLIDPHPSVGHIYADVAAEHGHPGLCPNLLNRRFQNAFLAHPHPLHCAADWTALVDQCFRGLVDPPPSRSFFPVLYERFADPGAWFVYPDVLPTLIELKSRRLPIAFISNWDDRLRPLLHTLKLASFFDCLVISCEVGHAKPNPAIFHRAASLLGLSGNSILHVGDHPQHDLTAARDVGFQALLIDRDQPSSPDHRIASLTQLLECA